MNTENSDQVNTRWHIDFDWFQQNNSSFSVLAQSRLCSKCYKRLNAGEQEVPADELMSAFKDCCLKTPDAINGKLPIMESIFRLFLANGNKPLTLEELGDQLSERLGGDCYRTSSEVLSRLLNSDQYYGLKQTPG